MMGLEPGWQGLQGRRLGEYRGGGAGSIFAR
jgi:hypothetical protein